MEWVEYMNTKLPTLVCKKFKRDLTGQRFGKLQVLSYAGHSTSFSYWACQCDCGIKEIAKGNNLFNGLKDSCFKCRPKIGKNHGCWQGYEDIPKEFWTRYLRGATSRDIEFDLTIEDGWDVYVAQDKRCALTGLPIVMPKGGKRQREYTASLDRINPSKGYVKDNVQWVHKAINHFKCDLDNDFFVLMCNLVAKGRPSNLTEQDFLNGCDKTIKTKRNTLQGENHPSTRCYRIIHEDGRPDLIIKGFRKFCDDHGLSQDGLRSAKRHGRFYRGMSYEPIECKASA